MKRPFTVDHLIHPESESEGKVANPFRVGLRNAFVALLFIALSGAALLVKYSALSDWIAWWAFAAVPAAVAAIAFGHAYLGAAIGGKRANNVLVIVLLAVLIAGCWILTRYTASTR